MSLITHEPLRTDDRGSTMIQFVLVLPVFLVLVFGSYELWKLVHLKQSLEAATIQAARYLSVEGRFLDNYPDDWQASAWTIIARELANESLLRDEIASAELQVEVDSRLGGRPDCPGEDSRRARLARRRAEQAQFFVRSRLQVSSPIRIPWVRAPEPLALSEEHWHYMECGPNTIPTPVP